MNNQNLLFTEMTAEEAAAINGGGWGTVLKLVYQGGKWVWRAIEVYGVYDTVKNLFKK
ncbi:MULTISPECIES: hypothetical protein [unclassified Nostoc]|uniref:hypothetical protein n=1 Tax=unclassified Nostoc TaxID=2593658 RepID=UPI00167402E7|nr:hypothetical protein [Nostoc sp. 'Peltigera membranacea cyanobiont' 232]